MLNTMLQAAVTEMDAFKAFLDQESEALSKMQTKAFMEMQPQKQQLANRCENIMRQIGEYKKDHPDQVGDEQLRKAVKEKWHELSVAMRANADVLQRVETVTKGVINRIVNTVRQVHNTHNAYSNAARNHRSRMSEPLSVSINKTL